MECFPTVLFVSDSPRAVSGSRVPQSLVKKMTWNVSQNEPLKYWSSLQVEQDIAIRNAVVILVHPWVFNHTVNITIIFNVVLVNTEMAILPPEIFITPAIC